MDNRTRSFIEKATLLFIASRNAESTEDIAAFPADESRLLSVIVLTPTRMEFVLSKAFARSGFWIDPADRKPPLAHSLERSPQLHLRRPQAGKSRCRVIRSEAARQCACR